MVVTADFYNAKLSEALVQQLADCAAFRTLVGAANATAAKSFIIEDDGGDPETGAAGSQASDNTAINATTASFAVVRLTSAERLDRGAAFGWQHEAEIDLIIRPTNGDTAPEAFRRARNAHGSIMEQFQALFGAATTRIAYGLCKGSSIVKSDKIHALNGAFICRTPITTSDLP